MPDTPTRGSASIDDVLAGRHHEQAPLSKTLLAQDEGMQAAYERVGELVEAGISRGTVWDNPARLLPPLVKGSLLGLEPSSIIEAPASFGCPRSPRAN